MEPITLWNSKTTFKVLECNFVILKMNLLSEMCKLHSAQCTTVN